MTLSEHWEVEVSYNGLDFEPWEGSRPLYRRENVVTCLDAATATPGVRCTRVVKVSVIRTTDTSFTSA